MLGRVGKGKDHRSLVDARHGFDDLMRKRPADGADANDRRVGLMLSIAATKSRVGICLWA
jgi:hypothetical protein